MSNDHRKSILSAINKFSEKQLKPKRKKPNRNIEGPVVLEIYNHLKSLGWSMSIVEAKSVYNEQAGRYMNGKTHPGYPDLSGNTPDGIAVFIEVKAPNKRSTIRPEQHEFLIEKIDTNCFAIVSDSVEYTIKAYKAWMFSDIKKSFLLHELPNLAPRYAKQDEFDLK